MTPDQAKYSEPLGRSGIFATTRWSVVLTAARGDSKDNEAALNWLCSTYWPAVFQYIRRTVADPETARDLTQGFFAKLLQKEWLTAADSEKGRFRTFLLTMVKRFVADHFDHARAQKRGGGAAILSIEQLAGEEASPFEPSAGRTPDQEFDRRWALAVLEKSMQRLRAEAADSGQADLFAALEGFLSGGESSETVVEAGERFGLGTSADKMRLHRWRVRYRELIREEIAQTVPRLADLDEEMRHLLAALAN
jgi:DNA-directed RNA polymerase specialized sigma24 family protein